MDIVGRLKLFLEYLGIPVTQFADNCGIPRPTLSQLLNGRNKTVRDEIIAKIHEAYPQLSIMWLMFGEGSMVEDANATSQPADQPAPTTSPKRTREMTFFAPNFSGDGENQNLSDLRETHTEGNISLPLDFMLDENDPPMHDNGASRQDNGMDMGSRPDLTGPLETAKHAAPAAERIEIKGSDRTITFHQDELTQPASPAKSPAGKHVVSIIVYYSDNSFQTFAPDSQVRVPMV